MINFRKRDHRTTLPMPAHHHDGLMLPKTVLGRDWCFFHIDSANESLAHKVLMLCRVSRTIESAEW